MTVQHEIVSKLADRLVADAMPLRSIDFVAPANVRGPYGRLTPKTAAALGRMHAAVQEARALGVMPALVEELARRGFKGPTSDDTPPAAPAAAAVA